MRLTEWHTPAHEVFCNIRGKHVLAETSHHALRHDLRRCQNAGSDLQARIRGIQRVEQRLLVLLQVLVVRRRQALQYGQHRRQVSHNARALAAKQLKSIGVLLLRHEARPCCIRVGELHHREWAGAVDDEVLRPPAQVHAEEACPEKCLAHKVTVAHGVHRVGAHSSYESELLGNRLPIDAECISRERTRSERQRGNARDEVVEPLVVPLPRGSVGEQPVAPPHRLRVLQVRECGHEHVALLLRACARHLDKLVQHSARRLESVHEVQARVRGNLVVSASSCVQLSSDGSNNLAEPPFVCCVNVLVSVAHDERVGFPLLCHLVESRAQRVRLFVCDDACFRECSCVRLRADDVLSPHASVNGERLVELFHERVSRTRESPSPQFFLFHRARGRAR
mmetsp:Transcript_589/g.1429  ORF Transcript_589/g.1429 Transcript_589/m.1429 type:complete len:395 (+) Transcript_589:285-1469(+)